MLPFFRKIRYRLAKDNEPASRTGRFLNYSRYAIGEIVLVVVGILIALQVNTWNEDRVARNKEREVLEDLLKELKHDLLDAIWMREINDQSLRSMSIIRQCLEEDLPYHDSLKFHFSLTTFIVYPQINGSVFEAIKSDGLDLISNKSLRDSIVVTYGFQKEWIADQKKQYQEFMMNATQNVFNTRFEELWDASFDPISESKMIPVDYEALKTDQEYLYVIRTLPNLNKFYITWPIQSTIRRLEDLQNAIEVELSRRN